MCLSWEGGNRKKENWSSGWVMRRWMYSSMLMRLIKWTATTGLAMTRRANMAGFVAINLILVTWLESLLLMIRFRGSCKKIWLWKFQRIQVPCNQNWLHNKWYWLCPPPAGRIKGEKEHIQHLNGKSISIVITAWVSATNLGTRNFLFRSQSWAGVSWGKPWLICPELSLILP